MNILKRVNELEEKGIILNLSTVRKDGEQYWHVWFSGDWTANYPVVEETEDYGEGRNEDLLKAIEEAYVNTIRG